MTLQMHLLSLLVDAAMFTHALPTIVMEAKQHASERDHLTHASVWRAILALAPLAHVSTLTSAPQAATAAPQLKYASIAICTPLPGSGLSVSTNLYRMTALFPRPLKR
jgi:hypothetical protein